MKDKNNSNPMHQGYVAWTLQNVDGCVSDPPKVKHFWKIRHGYGSNFGLFIIRVCQLDLLIK